MTRARRLAAQDLVAIPLPNGVFGMIFVVEAAPSSDVTFLVMNGFWPQLPSPAEIAKARPAKATGDAALHALPGYEDVWKGWFRGAVPADFQVVGQRKPSAKEIAYAKNATGTMIFGTGERLRKELHQDWRLKHDRKAVEAEWARADAKEARAVDQRKSVTLSKMLRERIFVSWAGHWPPHVIRETRRIFRDATKELIELEKAGTKSQRTHVLKRITTELNALDDQEGFIETVEREDLVARIEELASRVGLTNDDEKLTGHRDW